MPPNHPSEGERERLLAYLRICYWRVLGELDRRLEETGLTARQFLLLRVLEEGGPVNASAVGQRLSVSPANVSGLVDRLERKHYLKRNRWADDRRKVQLEITPEGRKAFRRARRDRELLLRAVFDGLSLRERRMLVKGLAKMATRRIPGTVRAGAARERITT
ncbi:Bacterial regulatory protein, MarR [mine drainage metagenome]|uniref:Bacterial regulatory protein, MarR n=1 Tax=mine drainage metagenome TaxID=410659 RepID=T1BRQ2_9ZZZZ